MENILQYLPGLAGILAGAIIASLWGFKRLKEAQAEISDLEHQRAQLMALIAIVHKDNFTVDIPEDELFRRMNAYEQHIGFKVNPITKIIAVEFMGAEDPIRMMRWRLSRLAENKGDE